jgi:hypothetical protein
VCKTLLHSHPCQLAQLACLHAGKQSRACRLAYKRTGLCRYHLEQCEHSCPEVPALSSWWHAAQRAMTTPSTSRGLRLTHSYALRILYQTCTQQSDEYWLSKWEDHPLLGSASGKHSSLLQATQSTHLSCQNTIKMPVAELTSTTHKHNIRQGPVKH